MHAMQIMINQTKLALEADPHARLRGMIMMIVGDDR